MPAAGRCVPARSENRSRYSAREPMTANRNPGDARGRTVLVIGHSDGIGQEIARQLVAAGRPVVGVSRRASGLEGIVEHALDVTDASYPDLLSRLAAEHDVVTAIHCAAIGGGLDLDPPDLSEQARVLDVNLISMVHALDRLTRQWLETATGGHFVGLSSLADVLAVHDAPAYPASKAAVSSYLRSAALLLRPHGIHVTNVRFGFVDTKLASAPVRPFMLSREAAARRVIRCLRTRPMQLSTPKVTAALAALGSALQSLHAWLR